MSSTVSLKKIDLGDGLQIEYLEGGQGKTLLFMHGGGGRSPEGAAFIPRLAERYRLLLPSRPGYDGSTVGNVQTMQDVAEVMASFIQKTCDGPVNIVAQSAGGAPATWLAINHPELVESLVLSAPGTFAARGRGGEANPMARPGVTEADRQAILYGDKPSWTTPPSEAEHARVGNNSVVNRGRFASPAGPANEDLEARLADVKCLTLLLEGTEDRMLPANATEPYQKGLPHVYRMVIYGAAHELPVSATDRWLDLVSDFIDRGEAFLVNPGHQTSF